MNITLTTPHLLHIFGFIMLFLVVFVRSFTLWFGTVDGQPNQNHRRLFVAFQHSSLTLIGATGIYLLYQKDFAVQPWFFAKIMLFAVLLSSLIKAFKKPNDRIVKSQRIVGLILALFCYCAILFLVFS
ncbi:MAG: SirB2 family protein [Acinetobacter sp.]|nr:SirB2 family protein [Acinetobacter sp.]